MHHSRDTHTHSSCWEHDGKGSRSRVPRTGSGMGEVLFRSPVWSKQQGVGVCESTSLLSLPHIWQVLSNSKDTYGWPVCSHKYIVDALSAAQEDCLLLFLSVGRWQWHHLGDPLLASSLQNVFLKNQFNQVRHSLSCQLFRRITNFLTYKCTYSKFLINKAWCKTEAQTTWIINENDLYSYTQQGLGLWLKLPFFPRHCFCPFRSVSSMGYMVLLWQSREHVLTVCAAVQRRRWDCFSEFGKMSAKGLH